jgi:hypothetical protein
LSRLAMFPVAQPWDRDSGPESQRLVRRVDAYGAAPAGRKRPGRLVAGGVVPAAGQWRTGGYVDGKLVDTSRPSPSHTP